MDMNVIVIEHDNAHVCVCVLCTDDTSRALCTILEIHLNYNVIIIIYNE